MLTRICLFLALMASNPLTAQVPEGRMELRLHGALYQTEPDRLRDFRLELIREDGQWLPVHGSAWTFNKANHIGELRQVEWDGNKLRAEIAMDVKGDQWIPGGEEVYQVEGGQAKLWQWQLDPRDMPDVVIEENRFHLRRPDGSSLTATFLKPEGVQIRAVSSTHEAPVLEGRVDARPSQRPAIHAWAGEQADAGDFLVVFTLQGGEAPPVVSTGAGVYRVGGLRLQVDGDTIRFESTP